MATGNATHFKIKIKQYKIQLNFTEVFSQLHETITKWKDNPQMGDEIANKTK